MSPTAQQKPDFKNSLSPAQQQQQNVENWIQPNPYLRPSSFLEALYIGPGLPASNTGDITPPEKIDTNLIFDSIRQIVETRQGERLLLPTFGSRILELIGEPLTPVFEAKVTNYLTNSVAMWEPRVKITSVRYLYNQNSVTITYTMQIVNLGTSAQSSFKLPRNM
jgi:phage baseplate assembly protein W